MKAGSVCKSVQPFILTTLIIIGIGLLLSPNSSADCLATPAGNLIFNGNFEAGNQCFQSDHTYSATSTVPDQYAIGTNANVFNGFFAAYGDHTTGSGLMLVVDCSSTALKSIWRQTVGVTSNADYKFSFWVANPYAGMPGTLQLFINGQAVGGNLSAPETVGLWQRHEVAWNSGTATEATLDLRNASTVYVGNDATLDDLVFSLVTPTNPPVTLMPQVLVDGNTPGYYNNALGTVLDGTQPQFPLPLGLGDDPTLVPASEPNLSAAASILGNWLASPSALNANWQWQSPVPATWNVNAESAIVYPVVVGAGGASNVLGDFDADNGLFVWVNGQYKFGAVAPGLPSPTGQYEYTNINLGTLPPGTNYIQVLREDSGVATGYQIRITGLTASQPPSSAQPPVITDFSPKSGTNGTLVTLTGLNFSAAISNNIVYVGAVRAPVIAASSTSLTVIVPSGATHAAPSVTVAGLTGIANAQFLPTFAGDGATLSAASFAPRVDLAHPGGPLRTVIADLDGDGKPDLAVGDAGSHGISLYRNISAAGSLNAASFAPRAFIPTAAVSESPWEIQAADVDGDGKLDLIEANRGNNTISILRNLATPGNLSSNSFAPSVNLAAGDLPVGVAVRDMDGDGRADVVAANLNSGNVAVFRNLGTPGSLGTNDFAAPVFFPAEAGAHSLVVVDLDGDAKPDIATANHVANSVSILRNTATAGVINAGSFAPQFSLPAPAYALHVKATDVDGDGKPDLLVSSVFGFALSVYRNVATPGALTAGSFAARVDFGLGGRGHTISHGDLNGDGKPDIVVDTEIDSYVSVFQNLSTPGSFNSSSLGARVDLGTGWNAWGASVGDLDGDGRPDLVFCNGYDNTISLYRNVVNPAPNPQPTNPPIITDFSPKSGTNGTLVSLTGLNFGAMPSSNVVYFGAVRATVLTASPTHLAVLVPSGATYAPVTVTVNGLAGSTPSAFQPTFDNGNATLSSSSFGPRINLAGAQGSHLSAIADIDGDGRPDLVVGNAYGHTISLFRNIGSPGTLDAASFAARVDFPGPTGTEDNPYGLSTADMDGDGKLDIVVCDRIGDNIVVYRNTATSGMLDASSLAPMVSFPVGADPRYARAADLDGDGRLDLVSCNFAANTISILRNVGTPGSLTTSSFAPRVDLPAGAGPYDVAIGDLDGDGKRDLAFVNLDGFSISVYRNLATPGTLNSGSFAARVDFSAPDGSDTAVLGDIDGDGKQDLVIGSFKSLTMSVYRNLATPGTFDTSSFAPRVDFATGNWTHNVALSDLNGDGKTDIATVGELDSYVSLFQNSSTPGSFTAASLKARLDLGSGWNGWGISVGDLDADGRPDLVFCNVYDNTVSLYHNLVEPPADPPVITQQPTNQLIVAGNSASFHVVATGTAPLAYQWSFNSSPISGATEATLNLAAVQTGQAGYYTVTITNRGGTAISSNALLSVVPGLMQVLVDAGTPGYYNNALGTILDGTAPEFPLPLGAGGDDPTLNPTTPPNLTTAAGVLGDWLALPPSLNANWQWLSSIPATWNVNEESAIVYPIVVGSNGLTDVRGDFDADNGLFVWVNGQYKFGGVAPGYSSPAGQYEYANMSLGDLPPGTNYIQVLREDNGVGTGYTVRIYTTTMGPILPAIVQQPASLTAPVGSNVTLTVIATGAAPLSYQWRYEGDNLPGETSASLVLPNVQLAQSGRYSVLVSNAFGTVLSAEALLTVVGVPPAITSQPQDRSVYEGKTTSFSAGVSGTAPFQYQWRKNEAPLANKTNATLTLPLVQFADAGLYDVLVTNLYGSVTSRQATLTVRPAPVCTPAPEGALAWWPGQSNTWDVVGGFDGVWVNTPALYSTGKVNAALSFTGGPYIQVTHTGQLNVGAGPGLTIEGWVRPNVTTVMPVLEWNDGLGNVGAGLMLHVSGSGTIEATLTDTNAPKRIVTLHSATGTITNTLWQHVALTYDKTAGLATIYVNGLAVAQTNAGTLTPHTVTNLYLGYRRSGSFTGSRFVGAMDEMTIYNRALAAVELQAIVAADEAGKCEPPPPPCVAPPMGIAAWWRGESNLLDSVAGNALRVTPSNYPATLTYQAGMMNTAFAYRGQNYLSLPRTELLDLGREAGLTIEGWILPNQSRPMPIMEWTDSNSFGASMWLSPQLGPTVLEANLVDSFGGYHVLRSPSGTIAPNTWQHIALTYNRSNGMASLYVNGNNVVTATNLGSFMPRTDLPLLVGAHPSNPAYNGAAGSLPNTPVFFTGAMDEIGLYRRALNGQEIRNLARARTSKCLDLPPTIGGQPQDTVATAGSALTLNVVAGGTEPLAYQWFRDGQPIAGANAASWVRFAQQGDAGNYTVVVTNLFGSVTSRAANVSVLPFQQCVSAPWGPVAFWRGESNTLDELGSHPAVWGSNTVPAYTWPQTIGGKVNTAFRFTGSNHLLVNSNANLNVAANGGFTVEGWIKPDAYTGTMPVFEWNDGRGNIGVGLMFGRTGPGAMDVTLTDYAGTSSDRSVTFATPNYAIGGPTNAVPPWAHVAVTYDGFRNRVIVYVNGVSVAERSLGSVYASPAYKRFVPSTSSSLYFGWRPAGLNSGTRFRGLMDELSVYYRPLTALELRSIFLADSYGKCLSAPDCLAVSADAAAWWRMEGNLQDSVNTNHALGLNGTLLYSNGVSGTALSFPSTSSAYVRAAANPTLNVGAAAGMTFETWLRPVNVGSAYTIAAWNNGSGVQGVSLGGSVTRGGDYLEANLMDTAGASHLMVAPIRVLTNSVWQHVAMTYDQATGIGALFVNGSPVTVTNLGLFTPQTSDSLYLGYRPVGGYGGSGWRYSGLMDETLLHSRALSGSEITASYRNAANRCMEPPVIVQQPQPATLRVNAGSDVTFSVLATGNPVLRYQWFQNGKPVINLRSQQPAAHSLLPTLALTNLAAWNEGIYHVLVSNAFGFTVSSNATLLVNYPPVANASNTVPLHISPNGLNAIAVLDGSRSSDPDRDPLSYEWFLTGSPTALATGAVAVVTLPVGTHAVQLVVDDGLLARTNEVTVEIITTAQAVERLAAIVEEGTENPAPLLASLRAALAAIDRSQPATAINQLQALQNKVMAQVAPVDPELAAQLMAEIQAIIDALNGGGTPDSGNIEITSIARDDDDKPHLRIRGKAGRTLIIETSTDGVNWEKIGVAKDRGGDQFEFDDAATDATAVRFYRVVSPK